MAKENTENQPTANKRGPAKDALSELASMLKMDVPEEGLTDDFVWGLTDAVRALANAAQVESITEGGGAAEPPESERSHGGSQPNARMLDGFDSMEAQDAFTAEVVEVLRAIMDQPEGAPEDLLAGLKASQDAVKAAIAGESSGGEGDEPIAASDGVRSNAGAESILLRSKVTKLEEENVAIRSELRRREINEAIDKSWREAKLVRADGTVALSDDDRAELVAMCEARGDDWRKTLEFVRDRANVPPSGTVTDPASPGVDASGVTTVEEALKDARSRVRAENPGIRKAELRSKAYELVRAEHPELLRG